MEIANASGLRIVLFGRKDESYMLGQACPMNFYYWLLQIKVGAPNVDRVP